MKKIFYTIIIMFASGNMFAQRTIDFSVDSILEPTRYVDKQQLQIHVQFKNNGPDAIKNGDSVSVEITIDHQTLPLTLPFPSALASGGTYLYSTSISTTNMNITASFDGQFCVKAFMFRADSAGGDSIKNEIKLGKDSNNSLCKTIRFNNFPAGINNTSENNFVSIYPNPANEKLTLNYFTNEKNFVSSAIYSLEGKLIKQIQNQNQTAGEHFQNIDISDVPSGIYILSTIIGNKTNNSKLNIVR